MNNKIFFLHHIYAKSRKDNIQKDLSQLQLQIPTEWVTNFLPNEIEHIQRNISLPELSLFLKHKFVFEKILKENIQYGIIFEDDIDLLSVENSETFLDKAIKEINSNRGDILWIGNIKKWNLYHIPFTAKDTNSISYFAEECLSRCTHAYIINQRAASTMLTEIENNLYSEPIDHFFNKIIQKHKLKSGWTEPFFTQNSGEGICPTTLL
jgi:GR25 family glycosyltransferase involved in LPS biosynthesis